MLQLGCFDGGSDTGIIRSHERRDAIALRRCRFPCEQGGCARQKNGGGFQDARKREPSPGHFHVSDRGGGYRSEEHTSELQSLMRISYAVFWLKKKKKVQQMKTDLPTTQSTNEKSQE